MYDPFAYLPTGYRFQDHQDTVATVMQCWISRTDIRLIAMLKSDTNYALLLQLKPSWFTSLGTMQDAQWVVVGVSAPSPSAADCGAAQSAIH
jgi:hypothetical protein